MAAARARKAAAGDRGLEFSHALEAVSREIVDPAAKLKFIRGSLHRYQKVDRALRLVPIPGVRRFLYRWLSLEGIRPFLAHDSPCRGSNR